MASSGNFNFSPTVFELTLAAFNRIGIRRASVLAEHLMDAQTEINLMFADWANRGPNLWTVDKISVNTAIGIPILSPDPTTIRVLDVLITVGGQQMVMNSLGRSEYAAIPDKTTTGQPTSFWFDRLLTPQLYLWPPPDAVYSIQYYRYRQIQDANIAGGETPEIPYRFNDAFVAGLAYRLSVIYPPGGNPGLVQGLKAISDDAWNTAASQDVEQVPLTIAPGLAGYYR